MHDMSGVTYPAPFEKLVLPTAHKGTASEIVSGYLASTPFEQLFHAPLPLSIPEQLRMEHTHVIAGSGHGKTQFLQHLIFSDLSKAEPPALIIIDSQGEMLQKIHSLYSPSRPCVIG